MSNMTANDIPAATTVTLSSGETYTFHPKRDVLHRGDWHGGERVAFTQQIDHTLNGVTTTNTLAYWALPNGNITRIVPATP